MVVKLLLKLVLVGLDYVVWFMTLGPLETLVSLLKGDKMRSHAVDDKPYHRQSDKTAQKGFTVAPVAGMTTMYELSANAFKIYADRPCMGTRAFLGQESPKVKLFGDVAWLTYAEVANKAARFGASLRANGLVPAPSTTTLAPLKTPCALAIFENTCAEWMIGCQGAFTQSIIVTTIYATLGMDAVIDAVNECRIKAILANKTNVRALLDRADEMPTLSLIVYSSNMIAPDDKTRVPRSTSTVKIVSFEEFVDDADVDVHPPTPPSPDTCAVIMYTSGSTGRPKGVVVKHRNLLAEAGAAQDIFKIREGEDVYLGYLPLAHILELMAEFLLIGKGCTIGYADPKTLTTTGAAPIGALEHFRPTIMAGVPKIWDVIKKGVEAKIAKASPVARMLFSIAFEARASAMTWGTDTPLLKRLVFAKFAKVVGGRLRVAISGGGPLNSEVQVFVRTCFGMPLVQGYGLTETCAGLTIQDPEDLRSGVVGAPLSCCQIKLVSTPDVNDKNGNPYLNTDTVDASGTAVCGRGEVLARGSNITVGYYDMVDKTAEEYDDEGFFHTGDIGQFMMDGSLRIVDRKKNLLKLKGGEYIALESMEMTYGNSSFVDAVAGGICCYGDGDMDRPVAIMQVNAGTVQAWAADNGVDGPIETLLGSDALMAAIMADLHGEWKKAGLSSIEKLKAVALITEPWTPENGCLTAANKLQRRTVQATFGEPALDALREKGIFK